MSHVTHKECSDVMERTKDEFKKEIKEYSEKTHSSMNKVTIQNAKIYDKMDKILAEIGDVRIMTQGQEERIKTLERENGDNREDHRNLFSKIDNFIESAPSKFTNKDEFRRLQKSMDRLEGLISKLMISTIMCFLGLIISIITKFL